jgi:ABC-type uncharacterized transport system permease subunit
MDRLLLVLSTFCFLFGFAYTMYALGARVYHPSRTNLYAIVTGFVLQTAFLYLRGQAVGRCPLTNRFEILVFMSWAMVLFYFAIGPAYRLSLLGAFTSPMVFLFQLIALLTPGIDTPAVVRPANPWIELHAAISIVAYGAFALACVAGVMYLAQERQLKTHHIRSIFYHLPPIRDLAVANRRLIGLGLILLTVGILAGFAGGNIWAHVWSAGVWLFYSIILAAEWRHQLSPRRGAWLSIVAFAAVLGTLWGLGLVQHGARS